MSQVPTCPPLTTKIQGIFTPILIPFDDRDQINEPELRRFVNWLIDRGVHGLYPNGSSGEFTRFTPAERRRIVEIVADENRGRLPIIAGAAEANVKETLAACEARRQLGARAVAIVAPFYYKLTSESVYAYFAEIARNSPIDLTLYNIPMFASPIDVPTIRRLADEFPRVIGIKDSTGDLAFMMRLISQIRPARPDFTFLTGWEAVLVPMLMIGCDGGTHASSNVVPEVTRRIYDLYRAGDTRRRHEVAVPPAGAVRRHALPVRIPRRLQGRRRAARHPLRHRPPAPDRHPARRTQDT